MSLVAMPLAAVIVAVTVSSPAVAAGGKNRLSEIRTDIEELYQLCEQAGTQTIVIEEDGVAVTLRCPGEPAPESSDE